MVDKSLLTICTSVRDAFLPPQVAAPVAVRSPTVFRVCSGLSLVLAALLLVLHVCMVYLCMESTAGDDTFSSYSHKMALMKSL